MMFVLRESPAQYEAFGFAQLKVPSGLLDHISIHLRHYNCLRGVLDAAYTVT